MTNKKNKKSVDKKTANSNGQYFVMDEIDDFRAYVRLKDNGLYYAYVEWYVGDEKRPSQWMLSEMTWLTRMNEPKQKMNIKKVVAAIDLLKLAEFISDDSVRKSKIISGKMAENAESMVRKAVEDAQKHSKPIKVDDDKKGL